jgi:putative aldouronate transport system permease protein
MPLLLKQKSISVRRGSKVLYSIRRDKYLYLLIFPGLLYILLFRMLPMYGLLISFQDYSPFLGLLKSHWVGFAHYTRFFNNPDFLMILRNTLAISFIKIILFFPIPIILSLLLNEVDRQVFKRTLQSIVYIPHFLSWVVVVSITYILFSRDSGIVNNILTSIGMGEYDFLSNRNNFWVMLGLQNVWKEAGWGTIIFLAAISSIDPCLYESGVIDGTNRIQAMIYITFPSIKNVVVTMFLLQLGEVMASGFEHVFLMQNSAVMDVAEVFETYVYRTGIQSGQFSYSTAVGFFQSLTGFILVLISNYLVKKTGEEGIL